MSKTAEQNLEQVLDDFLGGFEEPFHRGDMYSQGAHSINIAHYFKLAMEFALEYAPNPKDKEIESLTKRLEEAEKVIEKNINLMDMLRFPTEDEMNSQVQLNKAFLTNKP